MNDMKKWSSSLTIWGVVAMLIPTVANLVGVSINGEDVTVLTEQGAAIWQAVAAIIAVYGRIRAEKAIATKSRVSALMDAKPKRDSKGRFQ